MWRESAIKTCPDSCRSNCKQQESARCEQSVLRTTGEMMIWRAIIATVLVLVGGSMTKTAEAQTSNAAVEAASQSVIAAPKVRKALDDIKADDAATLAEQ